MGFCDQLKIKPMGHFLRSSVSNQATIKKDAADHQAKDATLLIIVYVRQAHVMMRYL
jgi:hypothetical protein